MYKKIQGNDAHNVHSTMTTNEDLRHVPARFTVVLSSRHNAAMMSNITKHFILRNLTA